jgi:hypothetical protein
LAFFVTKVACSLGTFAVPPPPRRDLRYHADQARAGTREIGLSFVGCDPEFLGAVGTIGHEKVPMVRGFQ